MCFVFQIKRLKNLEKEKDALWCGLEILEKARLWYLQRLWKNRLRQDSTDATGPVASEVRGRSTSHFCVKTRIWFDYTEHRHMDIHYRSKVFYWTSSSSSKNADKIAINNGRHTNHHNTCRSYKDIVKKVKVSVSSLQFPLPGTLKLGGKEVVWQTKNHNKSTANVIGGSQDNSFKNSSSGCRKHVSVSTVKTLSCKFDRSSCSRKAIKTSA